jgi:hypothetical protein
VRTKVPVLCACVAVLGILVGGCGSSSADAQSKTCAKAVDALSANLDTATTVSDISDAAAAGVQTDCPDRPTWRISARVDDIATKLNALSGQEPGGGDTVSNLVPAGTDDVALNSALFFLCENYGEGGTPACVDNS